MLIHRYMESWHSSQSVSKILIAAIIIAAGLAIASEQRGVFSAFMVLKPLTTIFVIALLFTRSIRPFEQYPKLILFGLCFCLAGDTFLLYEEFFVYGLSAFLIGHLLFLRAFSILGGFKLYLIPLLLLSVITLPIFFYLLPNLGNETVAVAVYMLVLACMTWQGICLWIWRQNSFSTMVAVAAILFMLSDTVIAIDKFLVAFSSSTIIILLTYWLSIGLLAFSSSAHQSLQSSLPSNSSAKTE